jgi:hypothetical protein
LCSLLAAAYVGVCLFIPRPHYHQYFTAALWPMIVPLLFESLQGAGRDRFRQFFLAGALVLAIVGCYPALTDEWKATRHGGARVWQLGNYREIVDKISSVTEPTDMVLAFWPGYVFGSGRHYYPGLENHFALRVARKLPASKAAALHIATHREIAVDVARGKPNAVVTGGWMKDFKRGGGEVRSAFERALHSHYRDAAELHGVKIYVRRD